MARRIKKWIQKAIKNPGALRAWMKKTYGNKAFTKDGKIKVEYIYKAIDDIKSRKLRPKNKTTILRRLYLALTLKGLQKKKKK